MHISSFRAGIERSNTRLAELRLALQIIPDTAEKSAVLAAVEELATAIEELRSQCNERAACNELTEAERSRYLELFRSAPVAYVVTDADGLIKEANSAAEALLRHEPGALAGKPLALAFHDQETRNLGEQVSRVGTERASRTWSAWVQARGKDSPLPVSLTLVPITDAGGSALVGLCLIMQDLTEMMKSKDRIRDLEDGLWRRVAERTGSLTAENERLRVIVAKHVTRHGALPPDDTAPMR